MLDTLRKDHHHHYCTPNNHLFYLINILSITLVGDATYKICAHIKELNIEDDDGENQKFDYVDEIFDEDGDASDQKTCDALLHASHMVWLQPNTILNIES